MDKCDMAAMEQGVRESGCFVCIITDNGTEGSSYFSREMCRQEIMWAVEAGKPIVPVVSRDDKSKIGAFIKEARSYGIDFGGINFCSFDRIGKKQMQASLDDIVEQAAAAVASPQPSILLDGWSATNVINAAPPKQQPHKPAPAVQHKQTPPPATQQKPTPAPQPPQQQVPQPKAPPAAAAPASPPARTAPAPATNQSSSSCSIL
eukprot:1718556-Pleurochrysis_carterae.AAC.2